MHFLPICSLNLQAIYPKEDQWLHFVSVNEIYNSCVGQETEAFHTEYYKADMLGFHVVGDKYVFEADWNYFIIEQQTEDMRVSHEELIKHFRKMLPKLETKEMLEEWLASYGNSMPANLVQTFRSKFIFLKSSVDLEFVNATLDHMQKQAIETDNDSCL